MAYYASPPIKVHRVSFRSTFSFPTRHKPLFSGSSSPEARMNRRYARSLEEHKEKVLALPIEALADSEKERCLKEETLRAMDDEKLITLQVDKRFELFLTRDRIRYCNSRTKLYSMKKNLLKTMYNNQLIEREINRRQVPLNGSTQQLPPSATPDDQTVPSFEELDETDLDLVCFEDYVDTLNTTLPSDTPIDQPIPSLEDLDETDLEMVSFEDYANAIDPVPLDFNIDELPDIPIEDLGCLFDTSDLPDSVPFNPDDLLDFTSKDIACLFD